MNTWRKQGLYDPSFEKENCGVGFIADIKGRKSSQIIKDGLTILKNMAHRGATGADPETGDGAGILIQVPHEMLVEEFGNKNVTMPKEGRYGLGMVFLPLEPNSRYNCEGIIERVVKEEGLEVLRWREVPVNDKACGNSARSTLPVVQQFIVDGRGYEQKEIEKKLYVIRKRIEQEVEQSKTQYKEKFYICSLSTRTVVYKGQFLAKQVDQFYLDFQHDKMKSAMAVVHQRYSTNTFPSWKLAHPYRLIAHNGEINTIKGNVKWMNAREGVMKSTELGEDLAKTFPIIQPGGSDSCSLDNVLELLLINGYSFSHALKMLVPQAWRYDVKMPESLRAFYEYHEGLMEPWDGPATIVFSDGVQIGATLDRNGLRPARYIVTKDHKVIMASELGVLNIDEKNVAEKGKLSPGSIFVVDTKEERIKTDEEIKEVIANKKGYSQWIKENEIAINKVKITKTLDTLKDEELLEKQRVFGYTEEELRRVIAAMVDGNAEALSSMGNDVPIAILSEKPQLLFNYFRQLFAQVTNPPIDPIREKKVMSLNQYIGRSGNILEKIDEKKANSFIELEQPILYKEKMEKLMSLDIDTLRSIRIPMLYDVEQKEKGLNEALSALKSRVEDSIAQGYRIIVLSDRDVNKFRAAIPSLLAVSSLNNYLIEKRLRSKVDIVIETGEARDPFHMAVLLGYGATAIYPYVALDTIEQLVKKQEYVEEKDLEIAAMNYVRSIGKGIRKITSKMGISTLRSFSGSQIFEAIGLDKDIIEEHFSGTVGRLSGIKMEGIAKEVYQRHTKAFGISYQNELLDMGGEIHWRKNNEAHLFNPDTISKLQHACRTEDYDLYQQYARLVNEQSKELKTIRGMFELNNKSKINIEEVEPIEKIMKRFATGAMSFGSLSKEAHENLAIAMNKIGAQSNSGEGGEDQKRYKEKDGINKNSSIKQIAAGRFGVNANYAIHADELQIKVAQGAKPGEGGHLPGYKVTDEIARVRNSVKGIDLISPPPHHDIYSIEDLEQLIYDLKSINTRARVSVKLVSEAGVGTVAAGVAKGSADMVLISGHDGGTGAAPVTSVKTAGMPWEIGLAETQQTLLLNNLRSRIRVQVDGQMKTGRDVLIGALLGAEEFGFATAPLVVSGCIMMRKCHNNTCPVGVATQDPELRKNFQGKPEHVINFFKFIAMEVRELLAEIGCKTLDEAIGRVDLIKIDQDNNNWKTKQVDFSEILYKPELPSRFGVRKLKNQDNPTIGSLDRQLMPQLEQVFEKQTPIKIDTVVNNVDRAIGATISERVIKTFGEKGLKEDTIDISLTGVAGQSFGSFLASGVTVRLKGDANDYVGKSLSGGKIIIQKHEDADIAAEDNVIAGNTLLYGATNGEAYINGRVGERFGVRNSGADAVVEGVGDHGCEYMTGGTVVILGQTGTNFGAGMSGGVAYVYDQDGDFSTRCNFEMITLEKLTKKDLNQLKIMLEKHIENTQSEKAKRILTNFETYSEKFVKAISPQYKAIIEKMA